MEESPAKGIETLDLGPSKADLKAIKDVIGAFLIVMRNYAFYPEEHPICQESITNVRTFMDAFLSNHDNLRLDVEKDRLVFRDEIVHQADPGEDNLGFLLFRDGIRWLEFEKGLKTEEISGFVKILNKYRLAQEDAEGDLVTALWEADFPSLKYKAVDIYWDAEPLIDLSLIRPRAEEDHDVVEVQEEEEVVHLALPKMDSVLWKLTPEEMRQLREMIREEEKRDSMEDVLDMVLVILKDQRKEEDLAAVLEFLRDEFRDTLAQGEFRFALEFLTAIHESRRYFERDRPWGLPLLDHFFVGISSGKVLGALTQISPSLDMLDSDQMELLRHLLLLLSPAAILALGPMLLKIRSSSTQRQFMEIIGILAKRDIRPLERLLRRREEFMVQRLIDILGHLEGKKPTQILLKMVRHPSQRIRGRALMFLLDRNPKFLKKLFPFIEDPSSSIRQLMLERLGETKSKMAESLLLDYVQQQSVQRKDRQHLLACYKALGQCGSSDSLPVLRSALLSRGWMPGFARSVHRQGAAIALMEMGTQEANDILEKTGRSFLPGVRRAYRRAKEAST
jgi:hypothetical protein